MEGGLRTAKKSNYDLEDETNRSYLDKTDMSMRPLNPGANNEMNIIAHDQEDAGSDWVVDRSKKRQARKSANAPKGIHDQV
jgi:hypothetical protein